MKQRKYLATAFIALLFLPLLSAKSVVLPKEELDLQSVPYIESDSYNTDLGFDARNYLPDSFDPYSDIVPVDAINYIEDDTIELDFDVDSYLPEGFNPYNK